MELNVPIAKLENGAQIQGYYVFGDIQIKKASSGRPYMSAVMSDATGSIDAKVWDFNGSADSSDNGRVVLIRGQVSEYRGSLQVSVNRFRFAGEQDRGKYDLNDLVASAPVSSDGELTYVRELLTTVADEDYRRVGETMLERHLAAFASLPAAKSIHHGFRGGLLMHTAGMRVGV